MKGTPNKGLPVRQSAHKRESQTRFKHHPGPPVVPFCPLFGEGSPTKVDYRKKGGLILSLLEDLVILLSPLGLLLPGVAGWCWPFGQFPMWGFHGLGRTCARPQVGFRRVGVQFSEAMHVQNASLFEDGFGQLHQPLETQITFRAVAAALTCPKQILLVLPVWSTVGSKRR